jgi:hypothetical protein
MPRRAAATKPAPRQSCPRPRAAARREAPARRRRLLRCRRAACPHAARCTLPAPRRPSYSDTSAPIAPCPAQPVLLRASHAGASASSHGSAATSKASLRPLVTDVPWCHGAMVPWCRGARCTANRRARGRRCPAPLPCNARPQLFAAAASDSVTSNPLNHPQWNSEPCSERCGGLLMSCQNVAVHVLLPPARLAARAATASDGHHGPPSPTANWRTPQSTLARSIPMFRCSSHVSCNGQSVDHGRHQRTRPPSSACLPCPALPCPACLPCPARRTHASPAALTSATSRDAFLSTPASARWQSVSGHTRC